MYLKKRVIATVSLFILTFILLIGTSAWFILFFFPHSVEDSFEKIYKTQAQSVGEQIGAQFFERYGDIQAMAKAISLIIGFPNEKPKVEKLLNNYARLYRLYDTILVVDTEGNILATNTESITGKKLSKINYSAKEIKNSDWFIKTINRKFTEDPEKGLQGTYVSTETTLSQSQSSPPIHFLFSALIYKDDNPTGVIVSFSRLDWMNQVVEEQYKKFLKLGMNATAVRVVDGAGHVLASYGSTNTLTNYFSSNNFMIEEPIETARFPKSIDWRIQINTSRSDIRRLIQYSKFYYIMLAVLFFGALLGVITYLRRQLESLARERANAVAEQTKLEHKVTEQTNTLKESLNQLKVLQEQVVHQERLAGIGAMATGLAHEIRNPLNVVINSSQYLIEHYMENKTFGDAGEAKHFAEMIIKHSERIDALVKAILATARKESNETHIVIDVKDLVKETLQVSLKTFELQYKVAIPCELVFSEAPTTVDVNVEDLRRIILNLIDNSLYSLLKKWGNKVLSEALLKVTVSREQSMVV
ncbi:MAG: sensor histidine kinase, partial [Pseudobdellovibrionaceae bacterium]